MFSASFIFEARQFDADFHRLDALIATAAKETEGYMGRKPGRTPRLVASPTFITGVPRTT